MWTSWKNVSSSAVHNPFPAPRPQETVVKAGSIFPREGVPPSVIDVPAHPVGGEIGKDTPQQCVADPTVQQEVEVMSQIWEACEDPASIAQ